MSNLLKNKSVRALLILLIVFFIAGIAFAIASPYIKKSKAEPLQEGDKYVGEPIDGVKADGLIDGNYYVKHGDYYYILQTDITKNYTENDDQGTNCRRIISMSEAANSKIPTLYLGRGDKLVFYSTNYTKDYIDYERFTDEGTSVGIYNLEKNDYNDLYTINIKEKSKRYMYINESSSASILSKDFKPNSDKDFTYLTIGSIGKTKVSDDILSKAGIIKGLKAGKNYKMAIYNGTVENDYVFTADTHYYSGMEHYEEANVPLVDGYTQEIEIPDYFLDGYYCINMSSFVRIVRESDYTDDTDFNVRLLEINKVTTSVTNDTKVDSETNETKLYSSIPKLNKYTAYTEGSFGYQDTSSDTESGAAGNVVSSSDSSGEIEATDENVTNNSRRRNDTSSGASDTTSVSDNDTEDTEETDAEDTEDTAADDVNTEDTSSDDTSSDDTDSKPSERH